MGYYVIIRGPAGSGKSTVSALLSARIGAREMNFDKLLVDLGLDYDVSGKGGIPLDRFLRIDEAMLPEFRRELAGGGNLVLDGNFYYREQILDLLGKLDFPHHIFTLKASLQECIKRDGGRKSPLGPDGTRAVFNLVSAFDCGTTVDTEGKSPDEVVEEIVSKL